MERLRKHLPTSDVFPARISDCDLTYSQRETILQARVEVNNLTKLQKLLLQQEGRCFYCGEILKEEAANLDHINPRSHGGGNGQHNLVACHRTQNTAFRDMSMKDKFAYVLKMAGHFKCPGK